MLPLLLLAAAQAATPAAAPPATAPQATPPPRFSILLPDQCPAATGKEVVVCSGGETSQTVPLPDDYIPNAPVANNPYLRGTRALELEGTPCAATQWGCQVGFGPPIVPALVAGAKLVGNALKDRREAGARRRDGDRRVAIALDAPPPAGHLEP